MSLTPSPISGSSDWGRLPKYQRVASVLGPRNAAMQRAKDVKAGSSAVCRMTEAERRDLSRAVRVAPIA